MVRTQLYLPEKQYEYVKKRAKTKNVSFAEYICVLIQKDEIENKKVKTIYEKYPWIGMLKGGRNDSDPRLIDEFVCDEIEGKNR